MITIVCYCFQMWPVKCFRSGRNKIFEVGVTNFSKCNKFDQSYEFKFNTHYKSVINDHTTLLVRFLRFHSLFWHKATKFTFYRWEISNSKLEPVTVKFQIRVLSNVVTFQIKNNTNNKLVNGVINKGRNIDKFQLNGTLNIK